MPSDVSERERKVLDIIETARAKRAKFRDSQITMAHGAGGKATASLIEGLLVPAFANAALNQMADAGTVSLLGGEIAMTTDSFVVKPIEFPGGSIGDLAVNGTVNDLAVSGARPLALVVSFILEAGLPGAVGHLDLRVAKPDRTRRIRHAQATAASAALLRCT